MFTRLQIVNIGLGKIASSQVERLDPPRTSLERFIVSQYEQCKRSELTKRRWVFATEANYRLTKVSEDDTLEQPYKYELPTDCLRPIRTKYTEWTQRLRFVWSAQDPLYISYVSNVDEAGFDPLFVDVLACRIALESVEYLTQSNTKKADAKALYDEAVAAAGKVNAFVIGPEDVTYDDTDFPFLTSRF